MSKRSTEDSWNWLACLRRDLGSLFFCFIPRAFYKDFLRLPRIAIAVVLIICFGPVGSSAGDPPAGGKVVQIPPSIGPEAETLLKNQPQYVPGQLIVKLKEGQELASLEALNRRFKVKGVEELFPEHPSPQETLAALRKRLASLEAGKEHTGWYWWAQGDSPEAKEYRERLDREKAQLAGQIKVFEEGIARLERRQARAPQGLKPPVLKGIYLLELEDESADLQKVMAVYQKHPGVEYAQPNYIRKTDDFPETLPNDTYVDPDQDGRWSTGAWGQQDQGRPYEDLWGAKKVEAHRAWPRSQGCGGMVAVVDTGVDYNHPDLADRIRLNWAEIPGNGVDDDGNGFVDDIRGWDFTAAGPGDNDPMDGHGHGTHVAGTIAATGNNRIGIIGIAPQATILPVKGLDDGGSGSDAGLARAVVYAAENGADVMNNSWGGWGSSRLITDAFLRAQALGVVCVVAAGNSNWDARGFWPAGISEVLTVAATTQRDERADFSNWGPLVDVGAPGGGYSDELPEDRKGRYNILSTIATDSLLAAGFPELQVAPGYARLAGTSMASPHVAGLAALILGRFPDDPVPDVQGRIMATADPYPILPYHPIGSGRVNAYRALTAERAPFILLRGFKFSEVQGDGDGAIEPGESGQVVVHLENVWADAQSVQASIRTSSTMVEAILVPAVDFGPMPQGTQRANDGQPNPPPMVFRILAEYTGYEKIVELILAVRADGRVWEYQLPPVPVGLNIRRLIPLPEEAALFRQLRPRIWGSRVVWSMRTNETGWWEAVYLHDLETNRRTRLSGSGADQYLPDISGDRVLWFLGRGEQVWPGRLSLVLLDLSNNKQRIISLFQGREPASLEFSDPHAVWDTYLVFHNTLEQGPKVIATPEAYLLNVEEKKAEPQRLRGLPSERSVDWGPAIWHGCVGWQSGTVQRFQTNVEGWEGFKARTQALYHQWKGWGGTENRRSVPRADFESVTVLGSQVVAIRQTYPERGTAIPFFFGFIPVLAPVASDIFLWDTTAGGDGSVHQLTSDRNLKGGVHLNGDRIVWSQDSVDPRSGSENWDIYLHNLRTHRTTRVTAHPSVDLSPRLSGSSVVWYRQDFSGEGGHSFVVADINHPPVAVQLSPPRSVVGPRGTLVLNATYSDPDGARDLQDVFLRIRSSKGDLMLRYRVERNLLYVQRGQGWVGGFKPGSAIRIKGEFGDLLCQRTAVRASEDSIEMDWVIQLNGGLARGTYPVILSTRDYDVSSKPLQAGRVIIRRHWRGAP